MSVSQQPVIETFGLGKRYQASGDFAVRHLNISIMSGEIYGFLGPNGAGKSTTIRLLMNFIQPTEGHAQIAGLDVVGDSTKIKQKIGYLPGEFAYYPNMTGHQFLEYMADLQLPRRKGLIRELAGLFDVPLDRQLRALSKGNRQKIAILQALAAQPDVLILDEPTGGLDPLMQEVFYEQMRAAKARGATVFFSSHDLSEVQKICDRVGFIRAGRLVAEQTIGQLSKTAVQTYHISFASDSPIPELKKLRGVKATTNTPRHVTVKIKGDLRPLFSLLSKCDVNAIDREDIDLEKEFLSYYKKGGK